MIHAEVNSKKSIGVMSVATNVYLDYWKSMVRSAESVTSIDDNLTFFVFTDKLEETKKFASEMKKVSIKAFKIPEYGWPEATLLRYQIFDSHSKSLDTEILMHLDADMLISSNPWMRIREQLLGNAICLVLHPGFWRPAGVSKFILYATHPSLLYRDLHMKIKRGGLGSWENDSKSCAFVDRKFRNKYFCGGAWFGNRSAVLELIKELSLRVSLDLERNVIASWHDESHINKWATENKHSTDTPELCFDSTYPQIKKLKPMIIAVRKSDKTR